MSTPALQYEVAISVLIITVFGYRQFNRWTDTETRSESTDVELLAFAQPRSFTSLWRFVGIAMLYCLCLVVLYFLLLMACASPGLAKLIGLDAVGIDDRNAWLAALFAVTGLTPMVPLFSNVERALREVMHTWAVVPTKAQQMACELASPTTTFDIDEDLFVEKALPRLTPSFGRKDFAEERAVTIAQKWVRLKFLICRYGPPLLDGAEAGKLRSPYTARFHQDMLALQRDLDAFIATDAALLRTRGGTPEAVALGERIDSMLHRLYVLMCCRALGAGRSLGEVVEYFRRSYGIRVRSDELASLPTDPIFDTLTAVTLTVLGISVLASVMNQQWPVHPLVWAANALAVHGFGLLIGWFVFAGRRRQALEGLHQGGSAGPVSRKLLVACVVLGFAVASVPTWMAALYHQHAAAAAGTPLDALGALARSWPWAFLGSATALAIFGHLEHTADREPEFRIRAVSAIGQAMANVLISALIICLHPAKPESSFGEALTSPFYLLILALTGAIGLVLGFFLPSVVHGRGVDPRGGAMRYRPTGEAAAAVFTYGGRQIPVELQSISKTGCALRFAGDLRIVKGKHGNLSLSDGTALPVYVVRQLIDESHDDLNAGQVQAAAQTCYAMQFSAKRHHNEMRPVVKRHLMDFLRTPGFAHAPG